MVVLKQEPEKSVTPGRKRDATRRWNRAANFQQSLSEILVTMSGKEKVASEQKHTMPGVDLCRVVFHLQACILHDAAALCSGRVEDEGFQGTLGQAIKNVLFLCMPCVCECL